jgi:hypothetical protein
MPGFSFAGFVVPSHDAHNFGFPMRRRLPTKTLWWPKVRWQRLRVTAKLTVLTARDAAQSMKAKLDQLSPWCCFLFDQKR